MDSPDEMPWLEITFKTRDQIRAEKAKAIQAQSLVDTYNALVAAQALELARTGSAIPIDYEALYEIAAAGATCVTKNLVRDKLI